MADAVLAIKIVADFTQGQAGLAAADSRVGRMQSRLDKLAAPAAGAALAIGAFGKAAVDAASRTQQAIGAVDSVFGKNAAQVKRWAASAATDVGLAKSEYMELASVLGSQLKNMGVPMEQVAGRTNELVKLGSDLAATYGGTTKEAVEALGSALRGETDPIERYGVSVKQADIAARMAKEGTDKLTGAAGKQAKTMALLSLVNEQTASAQGQFARESDSAAGSAQIAAAKFEDMQSALGTALLPAVSMVSTALGGLADVMARNRTTTQVIIGIIFALAAAVLVVNAALRVYQATLVVVQAVQKATWLSNPIFLVVAAVIALGAALVIAYKKSATFRRIVDGVWRAVKTGARAAGQALKAIWSVVWRVLSVYVKAYVTAFKVGFIVVRTIARMVAAAIRGNWSGLWAALKSGVRAAVAVIKSALRGPLETARSVAGTIRNLFGSLWAALRSGAASIGSALSAPFITAKNAVQSLIDLVQSLLNKIASIKMPSLKMPDLPGPLGASVAVPSVSGYVAPTGRSGRLATRPRATTGGGPTFIIQGAMDPEGVARQINRLLGGHTRRMGGAVA